MKPSVRFSNYLSLVHRSVPIFPSIIFQTLLLFSSKARGSKNALSFVIGLNWKGVWKVLDDCVGTLAIVLILIATSSVFGYCLTTLHVPALAAEAITNFTSNRIIIILLVLGAIMDMAPVILIATPIQFGIMVVLNCGIGLLTPPVGAVLFIGSAVGKVPMEKVVKATLPFYVCMIIALLFVSFIPEISLILPKVFGGYIPTNM
jgi:TRAP-type C4-dicarboxylate transport system permease large subunit